MAKPIIPVSYQHEYGRVEPMPYFLYEVSVYRLERNLAGIVNSKFIKSDKFIEIKHGSIYKYCKGYTLVKSIDLLGAPMEFIQENNLPIYELKKKKKK